MKSFAERAARAFRSEPEERRVWIVTRDCLCGKRNLGFARAWDAVICNQCGLIHVVFWTIDPIAKQIPESHVTPEMTRL
jgi:hypothetical protein